MEKKTPLYNRHIELGGKMTPFGGFLLPIQYETGILKEHIAVRESAGIFDVSHMGEILVSGNSALDFLQGLLTNDFSQMKKNQVKYTFMCYDDGGTVDDLLVYKMSDDNDYMLVVNASNKDKDYEWILSKKTPDLDVEIKDLSDDTALIALQGPKSADILKTILPENDIPTKYYTFATLNVDGVDGMEVIVSRTGYTGEDGFEFYLKNADAEKMFDKLMKTGADYNITPCGLGARDTLRLEAGMPLYGHELSENIDPITAGLEFFVKFNKVCDFIGKDALQKIKNECTKKRVGIYAVDRGVLREHCDIFADADGTNKIGATTSGTFCPYINKSAAMAVIDAKFNVNAGDIVYVDIRGRKIKSEIVRLPFYKRVK